MFLLPLFVSLVSIAVNLGVFFFFMFSKLENTGINDGQLGFVATLFRESFPLLPNDTS